MEGHLPDDGVPDGFDGADDGDVEFPDSGAYPADSGYGHEDLPAGDQGNDTVDLDDLPDAADDQDVPDDGRPPDDSDTDAPGLGSDGGEHLPSDDPDDQPTDGPDVPDPEVPDPEVPDRDDQAEVPPDIRADQPVGLGADPDSADLSDAGTGWLDLPDLDHVTIPEPAGGPPWVDTGLLGPDHAGDTGLPDAPPDHPAGAVAELRAALGEPAGVGDPSGPSDPSDPSDDAYQDLLTSDDPAVRSLARLWGPSA